MRLQGKRILLISPEPWQGLHMSKHHLSQALAARGDKVYFLDPPDPGIHRITTTPVDGVTVVRYHHWLRGVNRLPLWVNRWYYGGLIKRIANRTGGPFDIIWCFDTSRMQVFPDGIGLKLLHLADYDILHTGQGLITSADIIFTTCQVVADEVAPRSKARTINIGHALDARWTKGLESQQLRTNTTVRDVVFTGQLANSYNDWEGFLRIASGHPEIRFSFIGPYDPAFPEPAFKALRELRNVTFTGLMTKDELIPRARSADLLLFGFRSALRAKERANPHKVLEYLSTGNVIAGSYTMEYGTGQDMMCLAPEGGDLKETFDGALAHYADLNSAPERMKRIAFATQRTMDRLIERIDRELDGMSA